MGIRRTKHLNLIHTAGEVTEDNEKILSSGCNFLDLFKLRGQFKICERKKDSEEIYTN